LLGQTSLFFERPLSKSKPTYHDHAKVRELKAIQLLLESLYRIHQVLCCR